MQDRRRIRGSTKVVHRHRAGERVFRRVSELVYVRGRPRAILGWIDVGGMRAPAYTCELDPAKLRKAAAVPGTFYYDGVTTDPRYEILEPIRDPAPRPRDA